MSPLGLAILTGAGLSEDADVKHVHVTYDVSLNANTATITLAQLADELGLPVTGTTIEVCNDSALAPQAVILDSNGAIVDWVESGTVKFTGTAGSKKNLIAVSKDNDLTVTIDGAGDKTVKLDFYVYMTSGATEITVGPDDFGGYFYVEADTLYRNQDGKDMAATLTFPKVKIQSGFTLTMAANGDPSTFDFVMDAFPAYTYFDQAHKVVCDMTIVSGEAGDTGVQHSSPVAHEATGE
jgi:hypothetical protein